MPAVATIAKPELGEAARRDQPDGLVAVGEREEHRARRAAGGCRAAVWLLANARPNERSMPMTSPVERISGPRIVSTSGKRLNGSTASFTATCPPSAGGRSRPSSRSSASVAPTITRAATFASGTPVALLTNGTVRLARGLASMT